MFVLLGQAKSSSGKNQAVRYFALYPTYEPILQFDSQDPAIEFSVINERISCGQRQLHRNSHNILYCYYSTGGT
jgi:hypothetical protein